MGVQIRQRPSRRRCYGVADRSRTPPPLIHSPPAQELSPYGAFLDADACCVQGMANAAFFAHFPLRNSYRQHPPPSIDDMISKGHVRRNSSGGLEVVARPYAFFYVGDYDSAAWLYREIRANFGGGDSSVPLGWAIDPELSLRFPLAFDYMFNNLREQDVVISGDSGAGYVFPTYLAKGGEGVIDKWVRWNRDWFAKFDLDVTGFVINGAERTAPGVEGIYATFSSGGIVEHTTGGGPRVVADMPIIEEASDLPARSFPPVELTHQNDVDGAVEIIANSVQGGGVKFLMFRSILRTRQFHSDVVAKLQARGVDVTFLDPRELMALVKIHVNGA